MAERHKRTCLERREDGREGHLVTFEGGDRRQCFPEEEEEEEAEGEDAEEEEEEQERFWRLSAVSEQ